MSELDRELEPFMRPEHVVGAPMPEDGVVISSMYGPVEKARKRASKKQGPEGPSTSRRRFDWL